MYMSDPTNGQINIKEGSEELEEGYWFELTE